MKATGRGRGAALKTAWLNSVEPELSLVSRPLSIPLQGQPVKEPTMVKNYGPKYPPSHKKEVVQQPRNDLHPGLVTGTEWGFLDASDTSLPNSNSMAEESGVTSSGEECDISQDIPADYTARQTVRYKREYKKKRRKEVCQYGTTAPGFTQNTGPTNRKLSRSLPKTRRKEQIQL